MQKDSKQAKGPTISVQIQAELADKLDRFIEEQGNIGRETDRSKVIRGLIRRAVQKPASKKP